MIFHRSRACSDERMSGLEPANADSVLGSKRHELTSLVTGAVGRQSERSEKNPEQDTDPRPRDADPLPARHACGRTHLPGSVGNHVRTPEIVRISVSNYFKWR